MVQFSFFLLDSSVIYFLEVALFAELVVSGPCLFRNNPSFVELILKDSKLVAELLVLLVDLRYLRHLTHIKLASRFQLEPFCLELIKRLFHSELDEKVP